ncbi:MAG: hypothetical protein IKW74_05880 [Thermoguttaceae bacterium]|nr:hypothetical protein [Thermoguttaceae bacterium]
MDNIQKTVTTPPEERREINLKDYWIAGLLAWLVPGLGHIYQGRYAKGILFAVAIFPLLFAGLYMGSYYETTTASGTPQKQLMAARTVYYSWRNEEKRLYFIPQAMIGSVAIPAWLQAKTDISSGLTDFLGKICPHTDWSFLRFAMAPPAVPSETDSPQPTLNDVVSHLHSWYDFSTIFTVVAGLLNLLALFDAIGGPVWTTEKNEEKQTHR